VLTLSRLGANKQVPASAAQLVRATTPSGS
jgi:hypothetical protein